MIRYIVIKKSGTMECWVERFETATDLSTFMWGKRLDEYDVFVKIDNLPTELSQMRDKLVLAKTIIDC